MAPLLFTSFPPSLLGRRMAKVTKPTDPTALIIEAWAQGYMVGSIIIMICIAVSNIRRGVLLHKLILLELVLGSFHGTFIFTDAPVYGWYLSVTAAFLIISWNLHSVVAWMKIRPFISRKVSLVFIGTVIMVQPYWVLEIYADFAYFNNINDIYLKARIFEALFRDPWWIYATCCLFYNIHTRYSFGFIELMRISPRFSVMMLAMVLSIIFTIIDICAVTSNLSNALPIGINPFWKLAFVFKLLTDSVILDDFKTALDKLSRQNLSRIEGNWPTPPGKWTNLKRITSGDRGDRSSFVSRVPSSGVKVGGGTSEHDEIEGKGIAVTIETRVESRSPHELDSSHSTKSFFHS